MSFKNPDRLKKMKKIVKKVTKEDNVTTETIILKKLVRNSKKRPVTAKNITKYKKKSK